MELEKGEDKKEDKNIPLEVTIQNLDWGHDIFRVKINITPSRLLNMDEARKVTANIEDKLKKAIKTLCEDEDTIGEHKFPQNRKEEAIKSVIDRFIYGIKQIPSNYNDDLQESIGYQIVPGYFPALVPLKIPLKTEFTLEYKEVQAVATLLNLEPSTLIKKIEDVVEKAAVLQKGELLEISKYPIRKNKADSAWDGKWVNITINPKHRLEMEEVEKFKKDLLHELNEKVEVPCEKAIEKHKFPQNRKEEKALKDIKSHINNSFKEIEDNYSEDEHNIPKSVIVPLKIDLLFTDYKKLQTVATLLDLKNPDEFIEKIESIVNEVLNKYKSSFESQNRKDLTFS